MREKEQPDSRKDKNGLRKKAEEKVLEGETGRRELLSLEETERLVHELQVRQVELEMQNDELRRIQADLETGRERYAALYDFAPVGYITVSEEGLILEANLPAAQLLGVDRNQLIKKPLTRFILKEDHDIYCHHRKKLSDSGLLQVCELRMLRKDIDPFWVRLEAGTAQTADGAPICRVLLSDIAECKRADDLLRDSEMRFQQLFDHMSDGVAVYRAVDEGKDFVIVDINAPGQLLSHVNLDEVRDRRVTDVFPGVVECGLLDVLRRVWQTGQSEHLPLTLYKDGRIEQWIANYVYKLPSGLIVAIYSDTSEACRATAALQESDEMLRVALNAGRAVAWVGNLDDDSVMESGPVEEIFGKPPGFRHVNMASLVEDIHPDDRDRIAAAIQAGLRGETDRYSVEFRVPLADGNVHWLQATGSFERNSDGRVGLLYGVARDITERKLADEAGRIMLQRLQHHVENSPLAVVEFDSEFRIAMWSRNAETVFGWRADEVIGKQIGDLRWVHEDDHERVAALSAEMLAGDKKSNRHRNRNYRKDGSVITCEWYNSVLQNSAGHLESVLSMVEDVTERCQMEDELKRNEETYRSLFENMLNGFAYCRMLFDHDRPQDFVYLAVNEAFETQTGLKGVVGKKASEVIPGIRESDPDLLNTYGRVASTGVPVSFETYVKSLNMWFSVSVYSPQQGYFVAVFDVITKRKQAEKRQALARQVLASLNRENDISLLIRDILHLLKEETGFEAVGLRLREGEDFPYHETNGFAEEFVNAERYLCERNASGKIVCDTKGVPVLECMCGNVIRGRTDPALPFFTEGGSFWTNCTSELLATTTEKERHARTRNRCNGAGYESVALIPLRSGKEMIGLLQLNDHRKGMFTLDMIEFFEGMSASIGIALSRRRMAEEIRSLARFPSENQNPVLRIADDGTLLYANAAALSRLPDWHLEPGRSTPAVLREIRSDPGDGGPGAAVEIEYNRRIYLFSYTSMPGAGYTNLYGTDITEQKQAAQDVLQKGALLEAQANSTVEGILIVDGKGKKIFQNRRTIELWKIPEDIAENEDDELQVKHVMSKTRYPEQFVAQIVYLYGHPSETSRDEVELTDGTILDRYSAPVVGADGKCHGRIWTFSDITERKRSERAMQEMNQRLQSSMEALKLTQEKVIQQERLSALGQMASGIAHDFNNVLMPIVGYSELLLTDPAALDDRKELRHMLDMILSAGNDARQIVRRLRTVYRKEDDAEYVALDLAKIVESALSLTMPKWKEEMSTKGVDIEMVTDFQPVPPIRGNPGELREVLTNLIFNAVDAIPESGVITFRLCAQNGAFVVLEVTDDGVGMDDETLLKCREPFFTTKGDHGTGLGLSMTNGIVERHGGQVEIESKPGKGSTIRLRFPVPVKGESAETEQEKGARKLPALRILAIDDEERSRFILSKLLKGDGHRLEIVGSGQEGIDLFEKQEFDLVMTDRAMPEMRGDEVAAAVVKIRPGTPVIMLTGFGDIMKDKGECPPGVSRIVTKPVTSGELRRVMASVMRKSKAQGAEREARRGERQKAGKQPTPKKPTK